MEHVAGRHPRLHVFALASVDQVVVVILDEAERAAGARQRARPPDKTATGLDRMPTVAGGSVRGKCQVSARRSRSTGINKSSQRDR